MSDEISLSKGWSLEAYIAHNESMRVETNDRYNLQFTALSERMDAETRAAKEATEKVERATEKRFESVNEFRKTLADQASTFASAEKVNDLVSRFDRLEGRSSGLDAGWAKLISVAVLASLLVGMVAAILKWG